MNLIELLVFMLPAYVANAAPVVFGGRGPPLDLNAKLDKYRLLGKSKTIVGLLSGIVMGTLSGAALLALPYFAAMPLASVFAIAFMLSLGAMSGDVLGSFLKRRMGIEEGGKSVVMDRVLFAIVALVFAIAFDNALYAEFGAFNLSVVIVITFFLHRFANFIAHKAHIKSVPW